MIIKKKKNVSPSQQQKKEEVSRQEVEPQVEEFDFSNINFKEREERRKGKQL